VELTLALAEAVFSILAAVFAIMVVSEIDRQQIASAELMATTTEDRPPLPPFQFDAATPT
jgi:hypothetical protein